MEEVVIEVEELERKMEVGEVLVAMGEEGEAAAEEGEEERVENKVEEWVEDWMAETWNALLKSSGRGKEEEEH